LNPGEDSGAGDSPVLIIVDPDQDYLS